MSPSVTNSRGRPGKASDASATPVPAVATPSVVAIASAPRSSAPAMPGVSIGVAVTPAIAAAAASTKRVGVRSVQGEDQPGLGAQLPGGAGHRGDVRGRRRRPPGSASAPGSRKTGLTEDISA